MIKQISTFLFLLALSAVTYKANAQVRYTPADSLYKPGTVSNTNTDGEIDLYIYFHNYTDTIQSVYWKFVSDTTPSAWKVGLCDNNACFYNDETDALYHQRLTSPIFPGDSMFLKTVFNPQCQSGSAEVKVYVHVVGDKNRSDTLTYKTDAVASPGCVNAVTEVGAGSRIIAFPNPTTNTLYVKGMPYNTFCKVDVIDATGRIIIQAIKNTGKEDMMLNSATLAPGLYFLRVADAQNNVIKATTFSKQ